MKHGAIRISPELENKARVQNGKPLKFPGCGLAPKNSYPLREKIKPVTFSKKHLPESYKNKQMWLKRVWVLSGSITSWCGVKIDAAPARAGVMDANKHECAVKLVCVRSPKTHNCKSCAK